MDCVSPKGKCSFSISSDNKSHFMYEFLVGLIFQRRLQKSVIEFKWIFLQMRLQSQKVPEAGRWQSHHEDPPGGSQALRAASSPEWVSISSPELILRIPVSIKCVCLWNAKWHHPQPRTLGKKPLSRMLQLFGRRNCFFYFQFNFTLSFEEPHCFITTEDEMFGWHHRCDGHEFE